MSTEKKTPAPSPKEKGKKPFATPVLHRYGAVRTLTENVGAMTALDGGTNPKIKTT